MAEVNQQEKTTKKINRTRRKGDGGVYEYAPGKFRAFLDIGYENGKRKRKTFTGKSPTEVIKLLNAYKAEQLKGTLVADNKVTFEEYAKRWLKIKKNTVKATTYQSYEYIMNYHVFPSLGKTKIQKLTTANLNDYIQKKLNEGLSACSVTKHRAAIHNVLELAVEEGIVSQNVAAKCRAISVRHKEVEALTAEEVQKLIETAQRYYEKYKGHGNKMYQIFQIILVAVATGFRRGEVMALKWDCIDEENNTITVKENIIEVKGGGRIDTPKTEKSQRTVAVDPVVIEYLKELKQYDDSDCEFIFHSKTGKFMTFSNVHRAFKNLLNEAGLSHKVRFHDLRHTHATLLINKGIDFKVVSERLGHSNVTVTLNRYTHKVSETDRKAAGLIASMVFNKEEDERATGDESQNEEKSV